jgi:hypothetical protein
LCALAASIAQAALAQAALWSPDARLLSRHGVPSLFAAECTDDNPAMHRTCRVGDDAAERL